MKQLFPFIIFFFMFFFTSNLKADEINLALNKAAYHSSSINYNNTAHLATDGDLTFSKRAIISCEYSDSPSGEEKEKAFDGSLDTKFLTFHRSCWIQYDFGKGISYAINKYKLSSGNDEAGRDPKSWKLLASNDGDEWFTIDEQSDNRFTGRKQTKTFTFENTIPFQIYRFVFTENSGDDKLQFSEIELYENDMNRIDAAKLSSEWMSNSNSNEWIYVDLGTQCNINKIKLIWGYGYAQVYNIAVSDNAKDWQTVYSTTSGKGGVEEIVETCSARYVRMNGLESGDKQENISLVEFEVYGNGGLLITPNPLPKPLSDGTQYLTGGNWKIQRASSVPVDGITVSSANYDDNNWLIATVPGTVLTSYLNNGAIPDPNFGDQQLLISDAFFTADFWYRDSFTIPTDYQGKKVFLNFDGINWKADIFINGHTIGKINGAFIRGKFDITSYVVPGEQAYMAVLIHKNNTPGPVTLQSLASAGPNGGVLGVDNPTFHASIGWDWMPTIRGRNIGIHDQVFLSATQSVSILDPFIKTKLPLPNLNSADLTLTLDLKNHTNSSVSGVLKGVIQPGNIKFSQPIELKASEQKEINLEKNQIAELFIENPQLWWPNGYGDQFLYNMELVFEADGQISDKKEFSFGIREITTTEVNSILTLYVNGKRIYLRGGNWGFSESMLRMGEKDYDQCIRLHKEENFTMIRNWVGQTGSDYFYKACDKYGILIWDDFWLANPGDGPNPNDENMFMENARDKIKRVRNHPSVALYCGRNEGDPPASLNTNLQKAISSLDGTRKYIPHSASGTVSGFGPYGVYNDPRLYFLYRGDRKIHSEMGMPNMPSLESMKAMMPEDKLWPINEMWGIHDYCNSAMGASDYTNAVNRYGASAGIEDFCLKAQMVNMQYHKAMFEAFAGNKSNGILMWMSHPAWPSTVWQTYDYYREQTAGYYGCKKASEPIHILWDCQTNRIKISNNTGREYKGLTVVSEIYNMDGTLKQTRTSDIETLLEDEVKECFTLSFPSDLSTVHFLKLKLLQGEKILSDNFYWRSSNSQNYSTLANMNKVPLTGKMKKEQEGNAYKYTLEISNPTSDIALMVRLKVLKSDSGERVLPVFYSDNYFSLIPGESKMITLDFDAENLGDKTPQFMIEGWNIIPFQITEEIMAIENVGEKTQGISIYPSPTSNFLIIKGISEFNVEIIDSSGAKVFQAMNQNNRIDISFLPMGVYMINLYNKSNRYTQKIVKK